MREPKDRRGRIATAPSSPEGEGPARTREARWRAAAVAAQSALLLAYYLKAGVWVGPSQWLGSFTWQPATGPFEWAPFLGVALTCVSAITVFAAWMFLAAHAGWALLRRLRWEEESADRRLLVAAGLGLGMLSMIFFVLGTVRLYTRAATLATGLFLLACSVAAAGRRGIEFPLALSLSREGGEGRARRFKDRLRASPIAAAAGALCLATLASHLLGALLPPTSFDEMNYQLALPKLYALNHGFVSTPFNHLSYLPRNMGMLFVLGLLSGGPTTAVLFSYAMGLLAAAALYAFGRGPLGRRAAFLGACVFLLTPVVGNQLRLAAADVGTAFYELTAVFLFLRWREAPSSKTLALASVFWGLALGTKYTAAPGFAACLLLLGWSAWRGGIGPRRALRDAALLSVPAVALWSPWLVKNWLETGNPINPILSSVIQSRNFFYAGQYRPLVDYSIGLGIRNYFPLASVRDVLLLPWRLVVRHNDFNHDLGPVWLLCAPLAALAWGTRRKEAEAPGKRRWLAGLAALCVLYWAGWLALGVRMSRYFVAGLGLTSLLAGWCVDAALGAAGSSPEGDRPRRDSAIAGAPGTLDLRKWRWALAAPVLFALAQQTERMVYVQNVYKRPWGYLAGRCSLGDYLDGVLADSPYDAYDYVNRETPPDATVLVVDEYRTLYLDRNFLASTPWDHDYWHELIRVSRDAGDFRRRLRERGVSYVLHNDNYLRRAGNPSPPDAWTPEERVKERRLRRDCLRLVYYSDDGVWVSKVKEAS